MNSNSATPEWLNIRQAAKYLNVSIAFLRKCVRQKSIPHARIGSKVLRFDRAAMDAWLRHNGSNGEAN